MGLRVDASLPNVELGVVAPGPSNGTGRGRVRAQLRGEHGRTASAPNLEVSMVAPGPSRGTGRGLVRTQLRVGHPKRHGPIWNYDFPALSLK
jgi:hypothetical protein